MKKTLNIAQVASVQTSIRISVDTEKELRILADKYQCTMQEVMRYILEDNIKDYE